MRGEKHAVRSPYCCRAAVCIRQFDHTLYKEKTT
jgi:hypothetical protein